MDSSYWISSNGSAQTAGRPSGGVVVAFFFGGSRQIEKKKKNPEVGHAAGAYEVDIPYLSFNSPARNRNGRVGWTRLDKSNRRLDLDLSR